MTKKNNLALFFTLGLFIFSGIVTAQEINRNFISISFGVSNFHIKDEKVSPLIYRSTGIAPTLQYIYYGDYSRHYIEASYFSGHLTTSTSNLFAENRRGEIEYGYLRSITEFNVLSRPVKFFLGGSINSFLCHSDYNYSWISSAVARSNESWYWSNSLNASALFEYNLSDRELFSLKCVIPLLSNISRPAYSPSHDYNYADNDWKFKMFGRTEFMPNNFSVTTAITYQRHVLGCFNLLLNYEFYYSFYEKPNDVKMFMNNFRAGLSFCF